MALEVHLIDPQTGDAVKINSHGELVVGTQEHSTPYSAQRSTAGVSNIVPIDTGKIFVITYIVVSSDKTNVETHVSIYETSSETGALSTSEQLILSGGMSKNDRVVLPSLDLATAPSRFLNVETDTTATIDVIIMGYYEDDK